MPVYTTKRFGALALSSLVIGIVILSFVGWSVQSLFSEHLATFHNQYVDPNTSANSQVGKPMGQIWASINHTVIILEPNVVESIFTIKVLEPPSRMPNDTIELVFDDPYTYTKDDPFPEVLSGNLSWRGIFGVDLHVNDTLTIWTQLRFSSDSIYYVGGRVISYSADGGNERYGTSYYFYVEQGKIVKVTDHRETPTSTEMETEKLP